MALKQEKIESQMEKMMIQELEMEFMKKQMDEIKESMKSCQRSNILFYSRLIIFRKWQKHQLMSLTLNHDYRGHAFILFLFVSLMPL